MAADSPLPRGLRNLIGSALFLALLVVPIFMRLMLFVGGDNALAQIIQKQTPAMLVVPWAGGAAMIVVLLFKPVFGEMEFKALGFKFKGASGPVVLWVLCFLAETLAIRTLWMK